jgi:hypothetical protein
LKKLKKVTVCNVYYLINYTNNTTDADTSTSTSTSTDTDTMPPPASIRTPQDLRDFYAAIAALGGIHDDDWDEEEACLKAERLEKEARLEAEATEVAKRFEEEARLEAKRLEEEAFRATEVAKRFETCRQLMLGVLLPSWKALPVYNSRQAGTAERAWNDTWKKYQQAQSTFECARKSGTPAATLAKLGKAARVAAGNYGEALFRRACLRTRDLRQNYIILHQIKVEDGPNNTVAEFDMVVLGKGYRSNEWLPVATVEVKSSSDLHSKLNDTTPGGFAGRLEAQTTRHKNLHGLPVIVVLQQIDFTTGEATNQGFYASQRMASMLPSVPCIGSSGALRDLLQELVTGTAPLPGA